MAVDWQETFVAQRFDDKEAQRLEDLWAGSFGNAYLARNSSAGDLREEFWHTLLREFPAPRVLEVGCNAGANLQWIVPRSEEAWGVDVSLRALEALRDAVPTAHGVKGNARSLPFPDRSFDLVFTAGVLIHQPETSVAKVIGELVRVSRRYVLAIEYAASDTEEVPYRGQRAALFRRDYQALFSKLHPELDLMKQGALGPSSGWDDVTWWLFCKPEAGMDPR